MLLNKNFSQMAKAVAEAVSGSSNVLELAAGTGLVTREVAPMVGHHVATDLAPEMLDVLRARLDGVSNLEVRVADALNLDMQDGAFDAVLICNLLHLVPDPSAALAEARRVLRPGGLLLAPTFCHGEGVVASTVSRLLGLTGFPVLTRFKNEELDALIGAAAFDVHNAQWFSGLLPLRYIEAKRICSESSSR